MGFLDLASPLFSMLDGWISFLPETLRIILWASVGAAVSMYLYLKLSAQDKIGTIKSDSVAARKALSSYEGAEFDEMMPLATRVLSLSGKHFIAVLGPAVLSSLPALALIVWASNQFGIVAPAAGTPVAVSVYPETAIVWSPKEAASSGETGTLVAWPESGAVVTASSDAGELFVIGAGLAPVIHKKAWWNNLIGNPAGYLADDSSIELVEIDMTYREFLPFGPDWLREWAGLFFIALLVVSIGIKVVFKIH